MVAPTFHWSRHGSNPNEPALVAHRERTIAAARCEPIPRRVPYLRDLAAGRAVLDVGVVEHQIGASATKKWLHRHLHEVAATCVGVDILPDEVAELAALGYDIRVHDLVQGPLEETFDLVVAGELIEHLDQPGPFLRHVGAMLRPGGRVVLTTPNPYTLHRSWKHLRGRFPDSVDHALLLNPGNIFELADRSGLRVDRWRGVLLKDRRGVKNRAAAVLRRAVAGTVLADEVRCETLIYELVPAATDR